MIMYQEAKMTSQQALEFMQKGGQVQYDTTSELSGTPLRIIYKLFRNDRICLLFPNGPCCASVKLQMTPEEFLEEEKETTFEVHE